MRIAAAAMLAGMILLTAFPGDGVAQVVGYNHPELEWETIETEHFMVHYHSGLSRTPRLIAKIAEEIYGPITSVYRHEPDSKVHFIVRDHDDYSNGAAYYYDNKIEIWATPLEFLLRGTNNWLRNDIPSIYLQSFSYEDERRDDVLYGFPNRIVSYPIAGLVMPMWFAEGTAQYGAYGKGYDSWDSHRDMILRMHAFDRGVYSLEEMGVFGKGSIGNESVYNLGFSFTLYIARRFGDDALEKISHNMASPLTVNINRAVKKAVGVSAKDLYKEWKDELESSYLERTQSIRVNLVQGEILEQNGTANIYPAFSPDGGRIAYLSNDRSDFISHTGLYLQENGSDKRRLLKEKVESPPSWNRSGTKIVYSKLEKNKRNSFFYDIFMYDLRTKKEKQLTFSKRAKYPVFSPDESKIYYVTGADGIQNLCEFDVASGTHRMLTNFTSGEELFNSAVSPDGSRIAIAISTGYGRDIALLNADGSGFRYLVQNKADDRDPAFSPDWKKLYYSSDETGIYNIYEYNIADDRSRPVTNVLGGAFMPAVNSRGQLFFSIYTNEGYKLSHIDEIRAVDPAVCVYEPDFEASIPNVVYDDSRAPVLESKDYEFQYMTTFITPRLFLDYGKPKLGFYSFSSDALDKYSIFLGAAANKDLDRDVFAIFDYNKYRQTLFLELYNLTRHVGYFYPPNETDDITLGYWEVDVGARQKLSETQTYEFRTLYGRQSANIKANIPNILIKPLKYDYYKGLNFVLKWDYRKVLPRLDSEINPTYGREITVEYWRNSDEIFENFIIDSQYGMLDEVYRKYSYNKITLDWREYIGTPFIHDRSALSLRLQGGLIDKSVDDFLYFFAGGLTGIKAYSFYSLEGRRMLVGSANFRFPLMQKIDAEFGPWYFDKLYASIGWQTGDAWSDGDWSFDQMKKAVDLGLRLDLYSFYAYPTRIAFNAAYGFNEFPVANRLEGKKWKFFLTVLFGYDL